MTLHIICKLNRNKWIACYVMPYSKDYIIINVKGSVNEKKIESKMVSKSWKFLQFILRRLHHLLLGLRIQKFLMWMHRMNQLLVRYLKQMSSYVRWENVLNINQKLTIQEFPGLTLFGSLSRLPELISFLLTNCCSLFIAWFTTICSWWEWPNFLFLQLRLDLILQFGRSEVS